MGAAEIDWKQDPEDPMIRRAKTGHYELTVTRLALDRWMPEVTEKGITTAGPTAITRPVAEQWCEQEAARMKRTDATTRKH